MKKTFWIKEDPQAGQGGWVGMVINAIGSGFQAWSSYETGRKAQAAATNAAYAEKIAADEQAGRERKASAEQAAITLDKADAFKAEQRLALAGSGVDLKGDSATTLLSETDRLAERDALAIMRTGNQRSNDLIAGGTNRFLTLLAEGRNAFDEGKKGAVKGYIGTISGQKS